MPDEFDVKITQQAQDQLSEIAHYVAYNLQSPITAQRHLDTLEESITSLSMQPKRVILVKDEPWHSKGIRRKPVKNFIVYFWVDDTAKIVHVTAVVYAKRDQIKQLQQMDLV